MDAATESHDEDMSVGWWMSLSKLTTAHLGAYPNVVVLGLLGGNCKAAFSCDVHLGCRLAHSDCQLIHKFPSSQLVSTGLLDLVSMTGAQVVVQHSSDEVHTTLLEPDTPIYDAHVFASTAMSSASGKPKEEEDVAEIRKAMATSGAIESQNASAGASCSGIATVSRLLYIVQFIQSFATAWHQYL
jgi:hypothetical protein